MKAPLPTWLTLASTLSVLACSTTPDSLSAISEPTTRAFKENYQEIYRRTSTTARRCIASNLGPYASLVVDADLYPDLGYGEINVSLINVGVRNYYASSKIERDGLGTKMVVRSGNQLRSDLMTLNLFRWASGNEDCG